MDSEMLMPALRLSIVLLTMSIGLLTTVPSNIRNPSIVIMSKGCWIGLSPKKLNKNPEAFKSHSPPTPPAIPIGTVASIMKGNPQWEKTAASRR